MTFECTTSGFSLYSWFPNGFINFIKPVELRPLKDFDVTVADSRFEPIHDDFQPIAIENVRELESKLGAPLPDEYVAFLTRYGGCGFSGNASVSIGDRKLPIFTFFDGRKLLSKLEVFPDLAESKFGVADDMFGNPYVLDPLTGRIFFIDFSVTPPTGTKVAASFGEFLASIEVQPFE